jgi:hypothetical protein
MQLAAPILASVVGPDNAGISFFQSSPPVRRENHVRNTRRSPVVAARHKKINPMIPQNSVN